MLTRAQRRSWEDDGYLVLDGFLDVHAVDRLNAAVDRAWVSRRDPGNPLVADIWLDDLERAARMLLRDAPDESRAHPHKINDLYLVDPTVREITLSRPLHRVLRALIGGDVAICNSLNLEWGSQQPLHFDTYYMPAPDTDGLIVTSICLEDHLRDAGPLRYYPGSHRIPAYVFSDGGRREVPAEIELAQKHALDEIDKRGLEPTQFHGRAGDVFIWHEQLYHGGSPIADARRTRRTLVTHYWRCEGLELGPDSSLERIDRHRWYVQRPHQPVG